MNSGCCGLELATVTVGKCFKKVGESLLSGHAADVVELKCQGTNTLNSTPTKVIDDGPVIVQTKLTPTELPIDLATEGIQLKADIFNNIESNKTLQTSLCSRYAEKGVCLFDLKQELFRASLTKQGLEGEKDRLLKQLDVKDQLISDIKKDLMFKEAMVQQQKIQFEDVARSLSLANKTRASLTSRLAEQERKITVMKQARHSKLKNREELQVVHDAINSLRCSFPVHDPHHHTIDTIEQSVATLMERLNVAEVDKVSCLERNAKKILESKLDRRRLHISPLIGDNEDDFTKVVYFTERTVTPFLTSIPKRLGDITLRDFKMLFDRPGGYRYHFKALDLEYGMVKEEIIHDDDVLPGWDGKIIAWIEEDN